MIRASRLRGSLVAFMLLGSAVAAYAGAPATKSNGAHQDVPPTPQASSVPPATPVPSPGTLWAPLPGCLDEWSWSAMRVEWDAESGGWGKALSAGPSAIGAGIFGTRLLSDRPLQITRSDGSVLLMVGAEGMEFLMVRRGPDGRFHPVCGPDPATVSEPAPSYEER